MKLNPSIISCNSLNIQSELDKLKAWPILHLDIEDSSFVGKDPNITIGLKAAKQIIEASKDKDIDVHLIVKDPIPFLKEFKADNRGKNEKHKIPKRL